MRCIFWLVPSVKLVVNLARFITEPIKYEVFKLVNIMVTCERKKVHLSILERQVALNGTLVVNGYRRTSK